MIFPKLPCDTIKGELEDETSIYYFGGQIQERKKQYMEKSPLKELVIMWNEQGKPSGAFIRHSVGKIDQRPICFKGNPLFN